MNCNEPPEGPPIDWDQVHIIAKACAKAGIYSPAWFPEKFAHWFVVHLIKVEERELEAVERIET
jgi:hypothetical protein